MVVRPAGGILRRTAGKQHLVEEHTGAKWAPFRCRQGAQRLHETRPFWPDLCNCHSGPQDPPGTFLAGTLLWEQSRPLGSDPPRTLPQPSKNIFFDVFIFAFFRVNTQLQI